MPATAMLFLEGVILFESGALKFREFGAVLGILSLELAVPRTHTIPEPRNAGQEVCNASLYN
jgi:hypothetical protein